MDFKELNALGIRLGNAGLFNEAIVEFKKAIALAPNFLEAYNNLAKTCNDAGYFEECIKVCRQMLHIKPDLPGVLQNIAKTYGEMGRLNEALSFYYKSFELQPNSASALSDFLLTLNYTSASRQSIFLEHLKFSQFDAVVEKPNVSKREGKITIGYVSADFREHPVAHLIMPILKRHNRSKFKIILYSSVEHEDILTKVCKENCDLWREVRQMSDADMVETIKKDEVDILVDLSGHTGGNRLMVFAQKPAQVQVSWLGYMNTTGLRNIDYRITDEFLSPNGGEQFYTEKLLRLPDSFTFENIWSTKPISPLPALKNGYVTFASMNNFKKITDKTLDLWAKILKAVPKSKIIISAKGDEAFHRSIKGRFTERGVEENRVKTIGIRPLSDFLEIFASADIALDTFPFSGCITIYHGLFAGVPSVALKGESEYERNGSAVMKKAGLQDWIAESEKEYFDIAVRFANDLEKLSLIRQNLPNGFDKNEAENVTKAVENAFENMLS